MFLINSFSDQLKDYLEFRPEKTFFTASTPLLKQKPKSPVMCSPSPIPGSFELLISTPPPKLESRGPSHREFWPAVTKNWVMKNRHQLEKLARHHPYSKKPSVVRNLSQSFYDQVKAGEKPGHPITDTGDRRPSISQSVQNSGKSFYEKLAKKTQLEAVKSSLKDSMLKSCRSELIMILDKLYQEFGCDKSFVEAMNNFQLRIHNYDIRISPFDKGEKRVAQMIWRYSSSEYRKLRNMGLPLPSSSTVMKWIRLDGLENNLYKFLPLAKCN